MHPNVYCSTVCNNLDMEATYLYVHQQMNGKEDVVPHAHTHTHTHTVVHVYIHT